MNTKQLIVAAAVLAASTPVFANGDAFEYVIPDANFVSAKTRAEVAMELMQAQNEGLLNFNEATYPLVQQASVPERSRAEVRAEVIDATRNRTLDANDIYFGG